MDEHDKERADFHYQRGRRDGYNEGFAAGVKGAQQFIESHAGPLVIPLADRHGELIVPTHLACNDFKRIKCGYCGDESFQCADCGAMVALDKSYDVFHIGTCPRCGRIAEYCMSRLDLAVKQPASVPPSSSTTV